MVVDSSALVAVVLAEPERQRFLHIIAAHDDCIVGAPTLFETAMVLTDRKGAPGMGMLQRTLRTLRIDVEPFLPGRLPRRA